MPPRPARSTIVRYDDFTGGEFGKVGASAAPARSFTGVNVMRYRNGLLGPRPGVKALAPSGLGNGVVWGLRGVGDYILFGQGDSTYSFGYPTPGAVDTIGSLSGGAPGAGVQPCQIIQFGTLGYLSVQNDKPYQLNPGTSAVTAYASGFGGATIGVFSERLCVANRSAGSARVDTSATGLDFGTWPAAANFLFGAPTWSCVYLDEVRNRMVLATTGQEWWTMTGDIELSPTIKRTPRADVAPGAWYNVARLNESLYFVPFGEDFPVEFLGTVTDKLRHVNLSFTDRSGNAICAGALGGVDALVFIEDAAVSEDEDEFLGGAPRMLMQISGTWTFHRFGVRTSKLVTPVSSGGVSGSANPIIFTDGGGASQSPVFYVFDPVLDRPGKASDSTAQPGDNSTTPIDASVSFPEWWSEDGKEVLVRSVSVDFAKWDTGSASTNHIDLTVESLHRYNSSRTGESAVRSWDEAASETTHDEQLARHVFRVGNQGLGHGFKLTFSNLRGVALRRVLIEVDLDPQR